MKHLVIALHDVAPSTLDATARWRSIVGDATDGPVSLLIIPRYRGRDSLRAGPTPRWVRARAETGDEPVLHGWSHLSLTGDDGPELAGRDPAAVSSLIQGAVDEMRTVGLVTDGFIAPAYAHPASTEAACQSAGLSWSATRMRLRSGEDRVLLPSIGLGASTATRRAASPGAARVAARALFALPAVRLDLHPADLAHRRLERAGRELLARLLAQGRRPVTHAALLRGG